MNILPKKRWHVRTKDNIARVRKDEAAAREDERKKQEKLKLAESEARINFLRKCSGVPENLQAEERNEEHHLDDCTTSRHVDLFSDFKNHVKASNKELEKEKKEEQEKYEKKIGYLTYLGQDTNEALRLKSWYEKAPKRLEGGFERTVTSEKDLKSKHEHDPLTFIKALLPNEYKSKTNSLEKCASSPSPQLLQDANSLKKRKRSLSPQLPGPSKSSKKHKKDHKRGKHKKRSKERKKDKRKDNENQAEKLQKIEKLRKERLRRETVEKARQDALLAPTEPKNIEVERNSATKIVQKYNSQFNPELAKQNLN